MGEDADRAIGPTIALLLEVAEAVRHQAAAIGKGNIERLVAGLEEPQPQFRVLGDAPLGPAVHLHQGRAPDHGHGAMLDDGVALVARHHAEQEEAAVFGHAHGLEGVLVGIAIILGRLGDGHLRVLEGGHQIPQPQGMHHIIGVDNRHHLGGRVGLAQGIVEGTGLEARQGIDMEEAEAFPQLGAIGLHRLPDRRVLGVVIDHQDLEIGIVEGRQGVQGLFQQFRRLVVGRDMDGHQGQIAIAHQVPGEGPPPLAQPNRLGPFVGLGHDEQDDPQTAHQEQEAGDGGTDRHVLARVVIDDPDHGRGQAIDDQGQKALALVGQAVNYPDRGRPAAGRP